MLNAIVFDFDGVVVDSERMHFDAFNHVGEKLGLGFTWDQYLAQFIGFDDKDAFRVMLGRSPGVEETGSDAAQLRDLVADKAVAFEAIVAEGVRATPGVLALIDEAVAANLPIAIASGATHADIVLMLEALSLTDVFKIIVSADRVTRSKPDSESYAKAVLELAASRPDATVTAQGALAIEDTTAGLTSARDAGLMTLGLGTTGPAAALTSFADRVVDSLDGVTLASIRQWYH